MNYESKKAEIESKIKELQQELETLEKRKNREKYAEKLKAALKAEFEKFVDETDFTSLEVEYLQFTNSTPISELCKVIETVEKFEKPETKPENETKSSEKPIEQPKTEETNEPAEKAETPEEQKPVKMKMSLNELIAGMK